MRGGQKGNPFPRKPLPGHLEPMLPAPFLVNGEKLFTDRIQNKFSGLNGTGTAISFYPVVQRLRNMDTYRGVICRLVRIVLHVWMPFRKPSLITEIADNSVYYRLQTVVKQLKKRFVKAGISHLIWAIRGTWRLYRM